MGCICLGPVKTITEVRAMCGVCASTVAERPPGLERAVRPVHLARLS